MTSRTSSSQTWRESFAHAKRIMTHCRCRGTVGVPRIVSRTGGARALKESGKVFEVFVNERGRVPGKVLDWTAWELKKEKSWRTLVHRTTWRVVLMQKGKVDRRRSRLRPRVAANGDCREIRWHYILAVLARRHAFLLRCRTDVFHRCELPIRPTIFRSSSAQSKVRISLVSWRAKGINVYQSQRCRNVARN